MNVNTIQSINTPPSKAMPHASGTEAALDFVALIENAPKNIAQSSLAKSAMPDASEMLPAPAGADAKVATSAPVVAAALIAFAPKAAAVTPSFAKANSEPSAPTPTNVAPLTVKDSGERFTADIGKRSALDEPVTATQDGESPRVPTKPDMQIPKRVPDQLAGSLIALTKNIDIGHSEDESRDQVDTPSSELPATLVQTVAQPANSGPLRIATADLAPSKSESPQDMKAVLPRGDNGHEKIAFATAEIQSKSHPVEQPVTPFSMQVPTPTAAAPSTLTAPLFATPDVFSTQQLDLARDTQWIEQLTREIVSVAGQDGKLRFGLAPDGLGQLEVMVETQQDGVNIQFQTSTENAAKIIAAEQPKLLEELRQSGVRVTNSDLMAGHQMQGQRDQSRNPNPAWQTPSSQPNRHTPSSKPDTSHSGRFA
ncbi:flagellar hook-length control protein FliK [Sphingorhabdus sp.]|uniref:flagellar hook-length control protein FliK n=1 Tax=Sphingorhabdus sp. TaxID=1902408 RepID=UPI00359472D0